MERISLPRWFLWMLNEQDTDSFGAVNIVWNPNETPGNIENKTKILKDDKGNYIGEKKTYWLAVDRCKCYRHIESNDDIMNNDIFLIEIKTSWSTFHNVDDNWMMIKVWEIGQV